jgi:hypothetical protein
MKTKEKIIRLMVFMLLPVFAAGARAQGPYPNQGAHTVCSGDVAPYGVINTPGSTYAWTIIPSTGGNGIIATGNSNLTSVTWNSAGTCSLQVIETSSAGCAGIPVQINITVTPANTISLTSAAGTENQTVCINTAITRITYATTGATGATITGLPAGVTGSFAGNVVSISGTPTALGTFNYTVTLTGGCKTVTATGSLVSIATGTINLTSAIGTDNQSVCLGNAIRSITYATTGATGATVTGLPAGVTGVFAGNNLTITGTPSQSGTYNYTVTLTGGCGTVTANGRIVVNALPVTSPIYHN